MLTVTNVLFCEKLLQLADGRHQMIGIYPGGLMFDAPAGHNLLLDSFIMVKSEEAGQQSFDLQLVNTDGSQIGLQEVTINVALPGDSVCVAVNLISAPIRKPGSLVWKMRQGTADFAEIGRLAVRMQHVAAAGQGMDVPGVLLS